ncbi:hypothetical protein NLI96_g1622 [Meripilus lineatus]|uniref:Uncharacterized protein n=1 Tax=Meripilus lineatus TaxID=2056292 RepID=A0AAD5VEH8_9APHY|nr:hypothetical protein NLI96_g1622 [Physisporinus lineatus]
MTVVHMILTLYDALVTASPLFPPGSLSDDDSHGVPSPEHTNQAQRTQGLRKSSGQRGHEARTPSLGAVAVGGSMRPRMLSQRGS